VFIKSVPVFSPKLPPQGTSSNCSGTAGKCSEALPMTVGADIMHPEVTVHLLDGDVSVAQYGAQWERLAASAHWPSVFKTPEYFSAWYEQFGRRSEAKVAMLTQGEALIAVLPLVNQAVWRGTTFHVRYDVLGEDSQYVLNRSRRLFKIKQVSYPSSLPATLVRPMLVYERDSLETVARAAAAVLRNDKGWTLAYFPSEESVELPALIEAFDSIGLNPRVAPYSREFMEIHPAIPFAQLVARRDKKFRQNIRRAEAEAVDMGLEVTIERGNALFQQYEDVIAQVAQSSWKRSGRPQSEIHMPFEGAQRAFFRKFFSNAPNCEPVVTRAVLGSETVAILLSVVWGKSLTTLLTFKNASADKASPGIQILGRTIDWAVAQRLSTIDLNATAPYARAFSTSVRSTRSIACFNLTHLGTAARLWSEHLNKARRP
jgi:CelD/BcsL family acetyltransferase involved in cellulose biosynthesis